MTILSMVRLVLRPLLLPLHRWWIRRVTVEDPWEPVTSLFIRPSLFGSGSTKPFKWYLEGASTVQVSSVDELTRWLAACQYTSDPELFNEPDFWQHPRTFEHLRKGDCEDHALWAWRKLLELRLAPRLMVGKWLTGASHGESSHAWVVYESDGTTQLLEPVTKDPAAMVRPLVEVKRDYVPHFSVGPDGKMVSHAGYLLYMREQEERRRARAKQAA